jgi:hypothetical protein
MSWEHSRPTLTPLTHMPGRPGFHGLGDLAPGLPVVLASRLSTDVTNQGNPLSSQGRMEATYRYGRCIET